MKYPNAYKGVTKLLIAEILQIASTIFLSAFTALTLGGALMAVSDQFDAGLNLTFSVTIIGMIGMAVMIIGYILNVVGLWQASKDEKSSFRVAFIATLILLVLSFVSGLLTGLGLSTDVYNLIHRVLSIVIFVFTVGGISSLASRLKRQNMVRLGSSILIIMVVVTAISAVLALLPSLNGILDIVSAILMLLTYVLYLIYLVKAGKMLKNA